MKIKKKIKTYSSKMPTKVVKKLVAKESINRKPKTLEPKALPFPVYAESDLLLIQKLNRVKETLNKHVFEREAETEGILLAILSGTSCLFLGDVGAAKTHHIRLATKLLGLTTFDTLLSESTKPDQIFGPVDVPALAKGIQRTKVKGYAPDSEVLFFDEIFKANAIVLNPLLWIINEHEFRNGDEGILKCPTKATFAASNELPTDSSLKAVYDRLVLRYEISYLKSKTNIMKMMDSVLLADKTPLETHLSREEVERLIQLTKEVVVSAEVQEVIIKLAGQIKVTCGFKISDRKLVRALRVIQAMAVLKGRTYADINDTEILANIFWNKPEQINKVRAIVYSISSADVDDVLSYQEIADSIWEKATLTGNMEEAEKKLQGLLTTTEKFATKAGKMVSSHIAEKLEGVRETLKRRGSLIILLVGTSKEPFFKLTTASSLSWTTKQLRSVKFKWFRSGQYWWYPIKPGKDPAKIKRILTKRIFTTLQVTPTFKSVGD